MTPTAPARRPFFEITGWTAGPVRLVLSLILAAVVMQACLLPGRILASTIFFKWVPALSEQVGLFVFTAIVFQGLTGLLAILVMKRILPASDAHLRRPPGKSYVGLALVLGVAMGLIMLVADYWPQLLSHTAPDGGYSLRPDLAAGMLWAMITTGLGEETIFRGLLVGMLVVLTPGRVRLGSFEISMGGVLVSVLFGLAHYDSFLHNPLHLAVAQQIYAFVWGLTYVWLMERSKSLVAPIVAHGVGDFVEVALVMGLMAAWG